MKDYRNLVIFVLGLLLVGSLYSFKLTRDEYDIYRNTSEKLYREKIKSLQQELSESKSVRDSIVALFIERDNAYEALVRVDSLKTVELTKISGKFKNKTSKELEDEMNKQYNNQ
jgi:hypothetical protein